MPGGRARRQAGVGERCEPAGRDPAALLERPLGDALEPGSRATLLTTAGKVALREANPLRLVTLDGTVHTATLHRSGGALIVELERASSDAHTAFDPRLRASVRRFQGAERLEALCQIAAEEVQNLSGFDRVMVYRFDADYNGAVVAEAKREHLEPFLGLHYPASDIPPQARRLYTENWLRLIADVGYAPVPLVPELDPTTDAPARHEPRRPRSVSPIHIQYLKNIGVTASMSISLVIDGVLSGLLACHHYSGPHLVSFSVRETVEYLGQALSWHVKVLETAEEAERARRAQHSEADILGHLASSEELLDGLASPSLVAPHRRGRRCADARGGNALCRRGAANRAHSPARGVAQGTRATRCSPPITSPRIFRIRGLGRPRRRYRRRRALEGARRIHHVVPSLDGAHRELGGRPAKGRHARVRAGNPDRLSPRGSFALWREVVRGRSLPWERWQIEAAARMRSVLLGGVRKRAAALRDVNERLRETDRAKDIFIATVSHELRTPLNAINGWTTLLRAGNVSPERTPHAVDVIMRNTDTLKQLVEDLLDASRIASGKLTLDVAEVELSSLIESVCDAMLLSAEAKGLRLKRTLDSKDSTVLGDPTRIRQIVSNLLMNAVKFTPKGGSITRDPAPYRLRRRDRGQGYRPRDCARVLAASVRSVQPGRR